LNKFHQNIYIPKYDNSILSRVGLVALSTDFTIEQDFRAVFHNQLVNLYVNRISFVNPMNYENYMKMKDLLPSVVENILPGESLNVIAYGCTSGTIAIGEKVIKEKINQVKNGCHVTTPITAAIKAFKKMSIKKIAVLTPYPTLVNESIFNFLLKNNIEITSFNSFNINNDTDVAKINKDTIIKTIESIDLSESESIFISCTAMPVLGIIKDIESIISKPVFSSNQVIIWDCLRLIGINTPIFGYGKLLESY
tara:strand:- start:26 stop:781 length:756 start_codon:yes stop_codon:yes gene_type:complete